MGSRAPAVAAALLALLPAIARCDAGYGNLCPPAFDLGDPAGPPVAPWDPQPGDVILSNSTRPAAALMYAFAMTGPEVARKPTPSSFAMIWASVVLPRPGGPANRT